MKKHLFKTVALITTFIMLFSNAAAFADDGKYDKTTASKDVREYVKIGAITEIKSNSIVLGEKSGKVIFKLSDKTAVLDADDIEINRSQLEIGMNVEITYNKISNDDGDKVNEAVGIRILRDTVQIEDARIETISDYSKTEKVVTIVYETVDKKNRIIENKMDLIIDANTKIYNQLGDSIKISELKQGMIVDAEHSNKITKSYIPQAYAYKISVVKSEENFQVTETKILDAYRYNQKLYVLTGTADNAAKQILFVLSDNAVIKNQYGKNLAFKDLMKGQNIKVEHSGAMTKSLPPQCAAYSIVLEDDFNVEFIENAVIEEVNVKENYITANYEVKVGAKIYEYAIILMVDSETVILDSKGKNILLSNLKAGMKIDVEHEFLAILSSPPKSYAYRINISESTAIPPIDDEDCELYRLLIKLFVQTDSKEWLDCIKNHNHDWNYLDFDDFDDFFENMFDSRMDNDDMEDLLEKLFKNYRHND